MPEAIDVLGKFKGLPQKNQEKNMFNHETLLDKKLNDEIENNKWMEMELMLIEDFPPIGEEDLNNYAKKKLNSTSMLRKYKELPQGKQEKYMLNNEDLSKERLEKMKKELKNQ
ncbi:hypothetical protein LINPERHAP2_LOCUS20686 [Linum perenne]